jgi:hypothetical protein
MGSRRNFLSQGLALALGAALANGRDAPTGALARDSEGEAATLAARAGSQGGVLFLGNAAIEGFWRLDGGRLSALRIDDREKGGRVNLRPAVFSLRLHDATEITSDRMVVVGAPRIEALSTSSAAPRRAERFAGQRIALVLRDTSGRVEATWRAVLRDGSRYLRQEVTLRALEGPVTIRQITLLDHHAPHARPTGSVPGSPAASGDWYFSIEHPLSQTHVEDDRIVCVLRRSLPLRPGTPITLSSVIGAVRPGQMRRDFATYIERERAHPYRTFLHYNSWYDIGFSNRYSEQDALGAIDAVGDALHRKRGVVLSSYLFDDGWDNPQSLWACNAGFPDGFTRVRAEAARYGAAPGVWLSPWGGYDEPKKERLEYGRRHGYEINDGGFTLSGPRYFPHFRDVCADFIRQYGVNQFKFDGLGNASAVVPGSRFDSDFDAALALIADLRGLEPDLFVNLTTGTYPSPFWLRDADSIWRGGEDHSFVGVGTWRQKWMTYRDAATYRHVVRRAALYPLNSLMLHGIIYARHAHHLADDPQHDFKDEVRVYFGNGTQLQEMYITPELLTADNWDAIAESARWSRRNAQTLRDTHWIGGDPGELHPYGWAAWSAQRATLTLRNPSDQTQDIAVEPGRDFELPAHAIGLFDVHSPWHADRGRPSFRMRSGHEHRFRLAPFQVLNLEATPLSRL